jgi:hypothetical protein
MSGCLKQPPPLQSGFDVLACDAEVSGYLMQTDAISKHSGGGIRVPSQFVMLERVGAMVDDFEVLNPVVGLIAVDVVDIFGSGEFAAKVSGHDATMFFDDLPAKLRDSIPLGVEFTCPTMSGVADAAAKHLGVEFDVVGMALECLSATPTFDSNHAGQTTSQNGRAKAIIRRYGLAAFMAGGGAAALGGGNREQ